MHISTLPLIFIFPKSIVAKLCITQYVLRRQPIRAYEHVLHKVRERLAKYSKEDKRKLYLENAILSRWRREKPLSHLERCLEQVQ